MNLQRIALLTAIAQLLGLLCSIYSYVDSLERVRGATMAAGFSLNAFLITGLVHLLAQAMLVWFLFHLSARQKAT